ncbi:MAG: hypothetical protein Q9166_000955 [cf. Caloplaca sp. 2 TL-2023]
MKFSIVATLLGTAALVLHGVASVALPVKEPIAKEYRPPWHPGEADFKGFGKSLILTQTHAKEAQSIYVSKDKATTIVFRDCNPRFNLCKNLSEQLTANFSWKHFEACYHDVADPKPCGLEEAKPQKPLVPSKRNAVPEPRAIFPENPRDAVLSAAKRGDKSIPWGKKNKCYVLHDTGMCTRRIQHALYYKEWFIFLECYKLEPCLKKRDAVPSQLSARKSMEPLKFPNGQIPMCRDAWFGMPEENAFYKGKAQQMASSIPIHRSGDWGCFILHPGDICWMLEFSFSWDTFWKCYRNEPCPKKRDVIPGQY